MFIQIIRSRIALILLLGVWVGIPSAFSQVTEDQAREMLIQRGIPEDTLKARLIKKGYDPDNITPDQMAGFQTVVLETIREIEADQQKQQPPKKEEKPELKTTPAEPKPEEKPKTKTELAKVPKGPAAIFGQEIFRNNSIAVYQKAEDIVASDKYVLGTGDKIGVIGFGRSQFEQVLEIGPEGFVQPGERLPKILLRGIRFGDAKELLYQRFSQYYAINRGEFQVTLTKVRNVTVNVFGEARTTGAFTLPGVNTAFNVISAAGGPTAIGSVRRIRLIRGSESIPLDVYAFMNDPGVARNYFLQSNDYIHIPVAQKVVEITGAVIRPMSYELLDHENLSHLITYAGGAKANAYLSDVQVTRFLDDRKVITNVNLRELAASGGDYILMNGDIVNVKTIEDKPENIVTISGAVVFPGDYERSQGMRISDLLRKSILKPEARLDFGYLLKYQADGTYRYERVNLEEVLNQPGTVPDFELSDQDVLEVMSLKTFVDSGFFSVVGAVRNPDTFAFNPDGRLKLEDAILMSGGLLLDASDFGYIVRANPREPKTVEYIHFNLREAMNDPDSKENVSIMALDQIYVFDKSSRRDDLTVSVFGAVRNPGKFIFGPGMRLSDIISLAGGFRFEADNQRIDIARSEFASNQSVKITQYTTQLPRDFETSGVSDGGILLQPFDHVYVRSIPEFELQQTVRIEGEIKYPGTYPLIQDKERIYDMIERAGGLTGKAFPEGAKLFREVDSTGLVVIDLADVLSNKSGASNIVMLQGDVIHVPKSRDLVTIGGYVNLDDAYSKGFLTGQNSISVAFRGERSAKYYVDKFAAGVSEEGSLSELKVQFADGRVQKTKTFLFFNSYPKVKRGSVITVGPKPYKPPQERVEKKADWGAVLRDTMAQATAVLTLLILVDQLAK